MEIIIKVNNDKENLYCFESKERINIGEKYTEVVYSYDETIYTYKLEHTPVQDDNEDYK